MSFQKTLCKKKNPENTWSLVNLPFIVIRLYTDNYIPKSQYLPTTRPRAWREYH